MPQSPIIATSTESCTVQLRENDACSSPLKKKISCPSPNAIARGLSNRIPVYTESRCKVRPSLLDPLDKNSEIRKSQFWGCSKFLIVSCMYWMISHLYNQYKERNFVFEYSFFESMMTPFVECMAFWAVCLAWTFNALLNVEFVHRYGYCWASTLHRFFIEGAFFAGIFALCVQTKVGTMSCGFVFAIGNIYAMKVHSFIDVQYDLMGSETEGGEAYRKPTVSEFAYFIAVPSIAFEPEFPRVEDENKWLKVFFRSVHFCGTAVFCYVWLSEITIPIMVKLHKMSFIEGILRAFVPLWISSMLVFYAIFEVALNLCADLTGFGDRRFYGPWWNSTTFEEFNKLWNLPVHEYLLRHIYLIIKNKGYNKFFAQSVTLLYSSALHEILLYLVTGKLRGWFFFLMMFQPTLFRIQNSVGMKGTMTGNYFFWTFLILGISLAGTYYGRLWASSHEERNMRQYAWLFTQQK